MDRVPLKGGDFLVVALQKKHVSHHAQIKYSGGALTRGGCKTQSSCSLEFGGCDGVLVAMEGRQTSPVSRIPELDGVIFTP